MKTNVLLLIMVFCFSCANAGDFEHVEDQEKVRLLKDVSVLMSMNDPREFPAIVRVVSLPVPLEDCEPIVEIEEPCPQKDLYIVLSNWDIAASIHAFRIGRADAWRVNNLELRDKKSQSFWTASLSVESDKYIDSKKVAATVRIKITNVADQYVLRRMGSDPPSSSGD